MTPEIRRIRFERAVDHDTWRWRDAVTGEEGRIRPGTDAVRDGDTCVVEMAPSGATWQVVRWVQAPAHVERALRAADPDTAPPVLVNGAPAEFPDDVEPGGVVAVGAIHAVWHRMDARSTAHRDAGRHEKSRPAIIVAVDQVHGRVEVAFVYGSNSAVRRDGSGRRLRDWRAAGLRKPSVVSAEIEVRPIEDIGPLIGHLTEADQRRL